MWLWSVLFVGSLLQPLSAPPELEAQLAALAWKKRVVVLCAPSEADARYLAQKKIWTEARSGVNERDLVLVELFENTLSTPDRNYLQARFQYQPGTFGVFLIGKDTGIKLRKTEPVSTQELFGLIDGMPMRQSERKRRN
ncbi:hypothetical protein GCM10027275_25800 [Rhabdobacter roseus]|uniref:DUF4174 domain-containing protein n=1 Tax=Rhabdobacter roseus TaxID=1655419 RepID=A0A840TJZ1_9BACT|nr:DUF4174 domain-containing protein [Rhabdobacter roseus]MBB5284526.1 hypothetical protein [Rhabdobacter roseus]